MKISNTDIFNDLHGNNDNLQETFSTMGDPATAMRDPIFYRWHAFVDDIFQEHKNTLPRYTAQQVGTFFVGPYSFRFQ